MKLKNVAPDMSLPGNTRPGSSSPADAPAKSRAVYLRVGSIHCPLRLKP